VTTVTLTPGASANPVSEAPQSYWEQIRSDLQIGRLVPLGMIAVEFALVVAAIRVTNLETEAFEKIATVALAGFLVHHFLPAAWRMAFFGLLSVASVPMIFGWAQGTWLLGMGGLLIAMCHLPVTMRLRIALVLLVAAAMAAARVQALPLISPYVPATIWPILGAMFMFRLIVYLYDLAHGAGPFGFWRALAYFFMLPNVCFPLFPVVDYKTFQRSAYNDDALRLYQTGVKWMARGLIHLALYKLIYLKGVIEPSEAVGGLDAARYMISTYLLYLKISGLFHLIVGLLHMYGFGLAETHHLFLFSASFTDFWRRINIYWKDFIQKLVFNPAYFLLKKHGDAAALAVATMIAFSATWAFHSYQWFWIRGEFPVVWADLVFWFGLGVVVLVNVLWESRKGRRRSLGKLARTVREHAILAFQIAGTFTAMCVLWTIWSTPKIEELTFIWQALLNSGPLDVAVLLGIPAGIGALGALIGGRKRETFGARTGGSGLAAKTFLPEFALVSAIAVAFIGIALRPTVLVPVSPQLATLVRDVRSGLLNPADAKRLQRGYYEDLGDVTRFNSELWTVYGGKPKDWGKSTQARELTDGIQYEFIPSTVEVFKGALRTINSLGLRDREYALERGPETFRIGLIGASHDMGAGVKDDETYENLVEDRLNRELGALTGKKFEIMNYSNGGYSPTQKLAVIEQRIFQAKPDVILYVAHSQELAWTFNSLEHIVKYRLLEQFPFIAGALDRAGMRLDAGTPLPARIVYEAKLAPFAGETLLAIFKRFRAEALSRGIRPALVLMEIPDDTPWRAPIFDQLTALGQEAGLPVLDQQGAFDGVPYRKSLWIVPWDSHTNRQGHRLLADRLYALLLKQGLVPTAR
jgi:hypothetical protein